MSIGSSYVNSPSLAVSESARKRFLREAQAAAAVVHDRVVRILQVGETGRIPFLAMQLLEGESLEDRLRREPPLSMSAVVRLGREIAEGLAAAHQRGLIHRDIKPANLWLETVSEPGNQHAIPQGTRADDRARIKILDFGLARAAADDDRLTQSGAIVGTPAYIAPEQAAGGLVDHRCDLFSLGCVLYRLATGTLPFQGKAIAMLVAVVSEEPPPPIEVRPDVPPELSDLIVRLLAKEPEQRPQSAQEVADALLLIERHLADPSSRTAPGPPPRRRTQRHRPGRRLALTVFCPLGLGLLLALLVWVGGAWEPWFTSLFEANGPAPAPEDPGPNRVSQRDPPAAKAEVKIHEVGKDGLILEGEVRQSDPQLVTKKQFDVAKHLPAKAYLVRLRAGMRYRVTMRSTDCDAYLSVRAPSGNEIAWDDDSAGDLDAFLFLDAFRDGVYTVHAASYAKEGKFTLTVTEDGAVEVLEVGKELTRTGSLDKLDSITYNVRLFAGKSYVIDMRAHDPKKLDPYLHLLDADGNLLAEDDDSGGGLNARIRYKAWQTSVYRIVASDLDVNEGSFTLTVRPDTVDQSWRDGDAWSISAGVLHQADRPKGARWLLFGDPSWTDYDFEVEARADAGVELAVAYRVTGPASYLYASLGGFGNTRHSVVSKEPNRVLDTLKSVDGTIQAETWYRVRIEARGADCRILLDGKPLVTLYGAGQSQRGCVGVGTFDGSARFRNPKVATPDGKVLADQWPADIRKAPPSPAPK